MGRIQKQKLNLIQEANKRLMESTLLTEEKGCEYSYSTKECGPSYCSSQPSGGGERCLCNSWLPGSDSCDTSDTGSYGGGWEEEMALDKDVSYNVKPSISRSPRIRENKSILEEAPKEWCTCRHYRCERDTTKANSTLSWGGCTGSGACGCMSGWKKTIKRRKTRR